MRGEFSPAPDARASFHPASPSPAPHSAPAQPLCLRPLAPLSSSSTGGTRVEVLAPSPCPSSPLAWQREADLNCCHQGRSSPHEPSTPRQLCPASFSLLGTERLPDAPTHHSAPTPSPGVLTSSPAHNLQFLGQLPGQKWVEQGAGWVPCPPPSLHSLPAAARGVCHPVVLAPGTEDPQGLPDLGCHSTPSTEPGTRMAPVPLRLLPPCCAVRSASGEFLHPTPLPHRHETPSPEEECFVFLMRVNTMI